MNWISKAAISNLFKFKPEKVFHEYISQTCIHFQVGNLFGNTSMQTCSMRLFSNAFVFNYATRSAILSVRGHKKYASGRSAFIQDVNATYTARRWVLPGKFTWRLSIILQHAQTPAQGHCFEISQTMSPKPQILNPKTLKPKTLIKI